MRAMFELSFSFRYVGNTIKLSRCPGRLSEQSNVRVSSTVASVGGPVHNVVIQNLQGSKTSGYVLGTGFGTGNVIFLELGVSLSRLPTGDRELFSVMETSFHTRNLCYRAKTKPMVSCGGATLVIVL